MVESINAAAGDDLEKGLGAGEAAVAEPSAGAFSPRSFLCWHVLRFIMSAQLLWVNMNLFSVYGRPWSALAYFVLVTVPVLAFAYLWKPAAQDEEEKHR